MMVSIIFGVISGSLVGACLAIAIQLKRIADYMEQIYLFQHLERLEEKE